MQLITASGRASSALDNCVQCRLAGKNVHSCSSASESSSSLATISTALRQSFFLVRSLLLVPEKGGRRSISCSSIFVRDPSTFDSTTSVVPSFLRVSARASLPGGAFAPRRRLFLLLLLLFSSFSCHASSCDLSKDASKARPIPSSAIIYSGDESDGLESCVTNDDDGAAAFAVDLKGL